MAYEIDKDQLLALMQRDCEVFLSFYLGEELTLEIPEFHKELWAELVDLVDRVNDPERLVGHLTKLLGVPREHSKTTLIKLAVILFMRYSRLSFTAYVSNTFSVALNALRDIKDWLLSDQEAQLYGSPDVITSRETDGLFVLKIWVPGVEKSKLIIMRAFGVNTQIRGTIMYNRRPDLLIFDDVESQDTSANEEQQKKLDTWCLGTAFKSMAKLGVCIFIGNMIRETTLLARLAKDESWQPTVFGAIIKRNGQLRPLWEGRWTLEQLLEDYANYKKIGLSYVWEAEMMNLTAKDIFGDDMSQALRPATPVPDEVVAGFICLDPAFGLKAYNDESALSVHVQLKGGDIPCLVETRHGRWKEERILDELISMSFYWGLTTWVIEAQAAQRLLIPLFRTLLVQRKMSPENFVMLPILAGKDSKASRILAFRSAVASGSYAVAESCSELMDKLEKYSPDSKDKDDVCDSAAYGNIIWHLHGTVIKSLGRVDIPGLIFNRPGNSKPVSLMTVIP